MNGMEQQRVRTTYQYHLMPPSEQVRALETVVWCCRTLDNVALEQRRTWWGRGQDKSATSYQQAMELLDLKAACPTYGEVHSQVLQNVLHVLRRLDTTYQAFFRRVATGQTPSSPRFQGTNRYHSFTCPPDGNGAVLDGGMLSLSKIGRIRVRLHRPLAGTPKTVTISKEAGGWYACISCADVPVEPRAHTGQQTGIDVGLTVFLLAADGHAVETPRHYRKAERHLAKAQRRVARRMHGSHRRRKAVVLLKRTHQTSARRRRDFHHKSARGLLQQYDVIYLEDLQVRTMVRTPRRAKSISDAGWAAFRTILDATAACAGRQVIAVPAQYTSQDGSGVLADGSRCPQRVAKSLSVRRHVCPCCGLVRDRDENAAKNILRAGQARQAPTWPGAASVA
jgi:putative transposase